jgi:hypothetical protein
MLELSSMRDVIGLAQKAGYRLSAEGTCLYPSAGSDFKVLSLTHADFIASRQVQNFPNLGIYLLIDRSNFNEAAMGDSETAVELLDKWSLRLFGLPADLLIVQWSSKQEAYSSRTLAVLLLKTTNEESALAFYQNNWCPDVFVGITDGCRFWEEDRYGRTICCVNDLRRSGPANIKMPEWWITDHFVGATLPNPMAVGDRVVSDSDFPFVFEKAALLSSSWGYYGGGSLPGATLFKVLKR